MTQQSLLIAAVASILCCWSGPAAAQGRALVLGGAPPEAAGALPTRARKNALPRVAVKLKLEALRSEARPHMKRALFFAGDVVRLLGEGFGDAPAGRRVALSLDGTIVPLTTLSWSDSEVRVQLPDLDALGVTAREVAALTAELSRTRKKVVGKTLAIGVVSEGKWAAQRSATVVVAHRDFDGDGAEASVDCDDFDPRRAPRFAEVYDLDGIDEDCNAATIAQAPVPEPPADDALADLDAL